MSARAWLGVQAGAGVACVAVFAAWPWAPAAVALLAVSAAAGVAAVLAD